MPRIKRTILIMFSCILCLSGASLAHAQTSTDALKGVQQQLEQGAKEKQSVNNDIANVQQEMQSISTYIATNKDQMAKTEQKIAATDQLIEQKKEEIVTLEDKILARKDVMKQRLVALQHDGDNVSVVLKVLLEAKNFDDFLQRASAVTALFNADKDILGAQEQDLSQIQQDKKEIDSEQQKLEDEQNALAKQQDDLNQNLQKRQAALASLEQKVAQINQQMANAQQQKATIEAQIKAAQEELARQQAAAAAQAAAAHAAVATASAPATIPGGQELYVTATAYTPYDSGSITKLGYNIQKNPNMKLIAVDPSVIPLGSRVWVEGYGEAIAGDTGGAIVGNRIDVLVPTKAQAAQWGRRTVKVIILK